MFKRAAIMLLCLIMVFIATFGFIVGVVAVPTIYSYAAVNDDPIYVPLRDPSDAVIAFQAYCKSRDLTIEGSLTDAVTTFTTGAFNSACNEIGINISELQAEIKAEYDQSGKPVKFFLNDTGVMAMNRIFAQFLQDNELEVGDSISQNNPDVLYSGKWFVDADGNGCLVYTRSNRTNDGKYVSKEEAFDAEGTPYIVADNDVLNWTLPADKNFHVNTSQTILVRFTNGSNSYYQRVDATCSPNVNNLTFHEINKSNNVTEAVSHICVIYTESDSTSTKLSLGAFTYYPLYDNCRLKGFTSINSVDSGSVTNANVYIYTDNSINNNVYEGDTYINNEGDIINNNPDPDPYPPGGSDPGWDIGGGGGTATDGNGNTWNIQFPDFELPDLNIDWSINGLGEKFPFSIPFDLVALVTVLNAEPQAPRFEGTVNFGFTTWDYDINLQQFDSVAQACRIAEILLLVVGLILVTRSIIKG